MASLHSACLSPWFFQWWGMCCLGPTRNTEDSRVGWSDVITNAIEMKCLPTLQKQYFKIDVIQAHSSSLLNKTEKKLGICGFWRKPSPRIIQESQTLQDLEKWGGRSDSQSLWVVPAAMVSMATPLPPFQVRPRKPSPQSMAKYFLVSPLQDLFKALQPHQVTIVLPQSQTFSSNRTRNASISLLHQEGR